MLSRVTNFWLFNNEGNAYLWIKAASKKRRHRRTETSHNNITQAPRCSHSCSRSALGTFQLCESIRFLLCLSLFTNWASGQLKSRWFLTNRQKEESLAPLKSIHYFRWYHYFGYQIKYTSTSEHWSVKKKWTLWPIVLYWNQYSSGLVCNLVERNSYRLHWRKVQNVNRSES